jgi:hypothetical protein
MNWNKVFFTTIILALPHSFMVFNLAGAWFIMPSILVHAPIIQNLAILQLILTHTAVMN